MQETKIPARAHGPAPWSPEKREDAEREYLKKFGASSDRLARKMAESDERQSAEYEFVPAAARQFMNIAHAKDMVAADAPVARLRVWGVRANAGIIVPDPAAGWRSSSKLQRARVGSGKAHASNPLKIS